MSKIRLTKRFNWEMSHALYNYNGLCRNIHGHSYIMYVTVIGEPLDDKNDPNHGMVLDFGVFKRIVNDEIVNKFDHSVVLNKSEQIERFRESGGLFDRIHFLDYQPTCENMIIDFVERLKKKIPGNVKLHSIKLYETATSFAEWFADDQK